MAATLAFRASLSGAFHANREPGAFQDALVEMTGDSSYPTGGYPFTIAQLQSVGGGAFSAIESVEIVNPWTSTTPTTFIAAWVKSTNKVAALVQATAGAATAQVEITAATNLTTFTCTLRVRFI